MINTVFLRAGSSIRRTVGAATLSVALGLALSGGLVTSSWAQTSPPPELDKHVLQDIERHRAMAAAHTAAAQCLSSGRKEADCVQDLQAACKGIAIGKYCGMRHAH